MKKAAGFITLHRQILDWEWYRHPHTAFLFIHLLLSANFVDGMYKGTVIKRGQLVRSVTGLSTETGLSIQTVKTALAHLRLTGEITDDTNRGYRVITVVKYDDFQNLTNKLTTNQPPTNRQPNRQLTDNSTGNQPLYNNINNMNKETKEIKEQYNNIREGSAKRFTPPTKEEIFDFCLENGLSIDVDYLYDYYSSNGWMVGKNHMKDWRATVKNWARREQGKNQPAHGPSKRVVAQEYSQRDYSGYQDDIMASFEADMRRFKETGEID